ERQAASGCWCDQGEGILSPGDHPAFGCIIIAARRPMMEVPVHIASNPIFVGDAALRRILIWSGMVLAGCAPVAGQSTLTNRELLDRYCVTCHNQKSATAGLMLDKMNLERVGEDAA